MMLVWTVLCMILGFVQGQGYSNQHCPGFKTAVEGRPDKFIEIVHMTPYERDCSEGSYFNQTTCDCSILLIKTPHGTNIHGGVGNSMHHSAPVDMGLDPIPPDLANLPTNVLIQMLQQEQHINHPQFTVPTVPSPVPTQPVQSSWQEFTLPESGAHASLDQNQLVIRVPMDTGIGDTRFSQNVDQFSYVPTIEPIDPIVHMFGNTPAHQEGFMIPTTTPLPPAETYTPYIPEQLSNIPEVSAIITQIQQKVRSKAIAEQKKTFETFFRHFSANLAKFQAQKDQIVEAPTPKKRQPSIQLNKMKIQQQTTPLPPQPKIVTFPPDTTESPFPTVQTVMLPPPPSQNNGKDRSKTFPRIVQKSKITSRKPPAIQVPPRIEIPSFSAPMKNNEIKGSTHQTSVVAANTLEKDNVKFRRTSAKKEDVFETIKMTKSNTQISSKTTLPSVKTTPKPMEKPRTMKEILSILRRRLRKKGVPKEKITVSLLKSMISKDEKLIAMIRRSKKFIRKSKQKQTPQKNSSDKKVSIVKTKTAVKETKNTQNTKSLNAIKKGQNPVNEVKSKVVTENSEQKTNVKKQSEIHVVKGNKNNVIHTKDTKVLRNVNHVRDVNHDRKEIKQTTSKPTIKKSISTESRLPQTKFNALINNEQAVNIPLPPPPPPPVQASRNNLVVKKSSSAQTSKTVDTSKFSNFQENTPVEDSRDPFFGMPPPPPPPPFVSSTIASSTFSPSPKLTVKMHETSESFNSIKTDAKVKIISEVKEAMEGKRKQFNQQISVTSIPSPLTTASQRTDTSTLETTIRSPNQGNGTNMEMKTTQKILTSHSMENETSSANSNDTMSKIKPKTPSLDLKVLPPFPFLLLLKPNLLKHVIGKISARNNAKVHENKRLEIVKGISKPIILNSKTGLVYSSNESISGVKQIQTKKGNPAIRGIHLDFIKTKSWTRGHSQPMENFQRKADPSSRSLGPQDKTGGIPIPSGGIPIPSNLVADMRKVLKRVEKKTKIATEQMVTHSKDSRRAMHPPSRNDIQQRMRKANLLEAAKNAAVKTGLGISSDTMSPRTEVQPPVLNMSPGNSISKKSPTLGVSPAEEAVKKLDQQIANLLKTMNEGRKAATPKDMRTPEAQVKQPDLTHLGIGRTEHKHHLIENKTPRLIDNKPMTSTVDQSNVQTGSSTAIQTSISPSLDIAKLASSLSGTSFGGTSSQTGAQSPTIDSTKPAASLPSNIDVNGLLNMVKFALNQPANSVSQSPLMNQIKQLVTSQTTTTGQTTESPLMTQIKQAISMLASGSGSGQAQTQQVNANDILNQFIAKISPSSGMSSMNGGSANPLGNMLSSLTLGGGGVPQMNSGFPQMGESNPFNMGSMGLMRSMLSSGDMPFNLGGGSQMGMLQREMQAEGGGDAAEMASSMFGVGGGGGMAGMSMEGLQMGGMQMPGGLMFGS